MSTRPARLEPSQTREQRIAAVLKELQPRIDKAVRELVERAVDVPEAEEFGALDLAFRDAGQELVSDIRQASLASRKKRGTSAAASPARTATTPPSSTPTSGGGS